MSIEEVLRYWTKHVGFNPEQKSFNLLSSDYEFNRCGQTMKMIIENYDPSGLLAVMYAKLRYKEIISQCKVNLFDLVEHPDSLEEYIEMWKIFNSTEISASEDKLIESFNSKLSSIEGCPLIGEEDKENSLKRIYEAIGDVCESLNKCNIEVYLKGSGSIKIDRISNYIHIYDTLAEALIALENAPDMTYICYIRQYQSAGGYFAIFIKSNGTILSVNDRVNEKYIGQHQNSRNGRWQDSKKFELFPYNKVVQDVDGRDYKGYAVNYVVSKDNVPIKDIGADSYTHLLLAIILLSNKFSNFDLVNAEITYTNALLSNSVLISATENKSNTDLIPVENSLIANKHYQLHLGFTDEEVISGSVSSKFDRNINPNNKDSGWYSNRNQLLVDLYAKGFHIDPAKVARYDKSALLTDGKTQVIISEFVGSEYKMEAQAYRDVRQQLADYIQIQMKKELAAFGGTNEIVHWYKDLLRNKRDLIIDKAVQFYKEIFIDKCRRNCEYSPFSISGSRDIQVSVSFREKPMYSYTAMLNEDIMVDKYGTRRYKCPVTGNAANVWIWISPQTSENIKSLFDESVLPKIMEGWVIHDTLNGYNGNSILDNVDPVGNLTHILTYSPSHYANYCPFYVLIGLSKRGINKLMKEMYPSLDTKE